MAARTLFGYPGEVVWSVDTTVKTINEIREKHETLVRFVERVNPRIPEAMKGTALERTSDVMTSFVMRLEFLTKGIMDLAEAGNLYGTYALFRVFLEHILRTLAMFLKTSDEGSDAFAEQYLQLQVAEAFEYLQACKLAGLEIGAEPKSVLEEWFTEAKTLSDKEVRTLADPFRYRKLITTIRNLVGDTPPNFLTKILPNYSELSGFVHGGPTAMTVMKRFDDDTTAKAELYRIAELAVGMSFSAERWLLMLVSTFRPEFKTSFDLLDKAIESER